MVRDAADVQFESNAELSLEAESRRRRQRMIALVRGKLHWLILTALILGAAGGAFGYLSVKEKYQSSGQFEINPFRNDIYTSNGRILPMWKEWLGTRLQLIGTGQVLTRAMASEAWKRAVQDSGVDLSMSQFYKGIDLDTSGESFIIDLEFEAPHPLLAKAGVDALMTSFKDAFDEAEGKGSTQRYRLLQDRQNKLTADLARFNQQKKQVLGNDMDMAIIQPMFEAQVRNLAKLQQDVELLDRQIETAKAGRPDLQNLSQEELAGIDVALSNLVAELRLLQNRFSENKLNGLPENHYQQRQLRNAVAMKDQQIAERVQLLRSGAVSADGSAMSLQQLMAQKTQLERQVATTQADVNFLSKKVADTGRVEGNIESVEEELGQIAKQLESIEVEGLMGGKLAIVSTGGMPTEPSNPTEPIKKAVMYGGAAAMLGCGVILGIGLLDPRLRRIEDAEADLPEGGRLLGILPTLPADLNDPEQAVLVAHSVHHIRTLLQIGRDHSGNAFSITSPAAGSGKTSLTIALGLSFSASGCKTLLIDADIVGGGLTRRMGFVVHPRLGQVLRHMGVVTEPQIGDALRVAQASGAKIGETLVDLGYATQADVDEALSRQQEQSVGILDAAGECKFEECVAPTGIKNLYVLPLGEALPQQAGALSPAALRRIVAQARNQFDVVVLDTGPLLGSLEASMAAAEVDSTVLIVSRGDAKPVVSKCVEHLRAVRGRLAGIVFNHALQADIQRSTYASVTMSQGRHPANTARVSDIDADTSARFGPLATAVACYAAGGASVRARDGARKPANDGKAFDDAEERRKALASAAVSGGNGNGNGHGKANGNGNGNGNGKH